MWRMHIACARIIHSTLLITLRDVAPHINRCPTRGQTRTSKVVGSRSHHRPQRHLRTVRSTERSFVWVATRLWRDEWALLIGQLRQGNCNDEQRTGGGATRMGVRPQGQRSAQGAHPSFPSSLATYDLPSAHTRRLRPLHLPSTLTALQYSGFTSPAHFALQHNPPSCSHRRQHCVGPLTAYVLCWRPLSMRNYRLTVTTPAHSFGGGTAQYRPARAGASQ